MQQGDQAIPEASKMLDVELLRGPPHVPEAAKSRQGSPHDATYQRSVLNGVSRTFALTIPRLPAQLVDVVTNAYLLCRIADTIEDEPALESDRRRMLHGRFLEVVEGEADSESFAQELSLYLSARTSPAEHELVRTTARVVRVTHGFGESQRAAIIRCLRVMCAGMGRFDRACRHLGLRDVAEWREYCYFVAGVVGEMLTEFFCAYSPAIAENRTVLERKAVSFGQGLQMTNILRDIWDDLAEGRCWLPRDVFAVHGFDLRDLSVTGRAHQFDAGLGELVSIAHGHLREALDYTLLIPARETRVRHFCLWTLGMALLTLRKIHEHRAPSAVKIRRLAVRATNLATATLATNDRALRLLFAGYSTGLPRPARNGLLRTHS